MSDCLRRVRFRAAAVLIGRLLDSGCTFRIDENRRLILKVATAIEDDDRKLIAMLRDDMVFLIHEGKILER